ncbi:MAG: hypothetical protein K0S47_1533 [Herbinix sp.]|jgi:alpha-beta hydrolase superfamily lysophospholipase|nr:hypothetical protein [Herbinix sp.]
MNVINYITITQKDGYKHKLTQICCSNKPKASILILHGMAEHQKRYQAIIDYLVGNDFDVYIYDHRGHGTDKKLNELGYIAPTKGYHLLVEDAIEISTYIEKNNRTNKFFLIGHSMGSLIARNIIQTYDKYHGVILSGTTYPSKFVARMGWLVASFLKGVKGPKHNSPYLNSLLFGSKLYTSLAKRTAYDWLTRSNPVVGAYIHDPYSGFICSTSFYQDLIKLSLQAIKKSNIKLTKRELPLYIISGNMDPVGGYGKEIKKYISILKKCNFSNVTSKIYPDCRHELFHELNRDEVFSDLLIWLSKRS